MESTFVLIDRRLINKFREWSSHTFRNDTHYDKKMVEVLLIKCVGIDDICAGNIPGKVKKFIKGELSF